MTASDIDDHNGRSIHDEYWVMQVFPAIWKNPEDFINGARHSKPK
jgi:hypothetical protein